VSLEGPVRRQDLLASLSTHKISSTKWIQIHNPNSNLPALKTVLQGYW